MFGGLTPTEWNVWQKTFLHAKPNTEAEEVELSGLTGRIPLYLQYWNFEAMDKKKDKFETVRNRFLKRNGAIIDKCLRDFIRDVIDKQRHIVLMVAAIGGLEENVDLSLFDQRYFYVKRDEPRNLIPISELVCFCFPYICVFNEQMKKMHIFA